MVSSTDFLFKSGLLLFVGAPDAACVSEMSHCGAQNKRFTKPTWLRGVTKRRILDALQDAVRNSLRVKWQSSVLHDTGLSGETRGEPSL